jgi:Tfp pilus assembly protein PilF
VPVPVVAYALALFARLKNDLQPAWRDVLPGELKKEFDAGVAYLQAMGTPLFDEQRIEKEAAAHALYKQAFRHYQAGAIEEAVAALEKTLSLTDDANLNAHALHNIGYYKIRLGDYTGSISALRRCLALRPGQLYAHDNLGFALLMTGELEAGRAHLEKALHSERNNEAYTFRNFALYHQKKQDFDAAAAYFKKSFEANTPVDLLDFLYGQFLLETSQPTQGLAHIRKAAQLGEREAVEWLRALDSNSEHS